MTAYSDAVDALRAALVSNTPYKIKPETVAEFMIAVCDGKVSIEDIDDTLESTADDQPLSANQGRALKELIDALDSSISGFEDALDEKAPLASPDLTGNPTAPNQSASNNSTRIANTAYVDAAVAVVAAVVSGALVFKGAWDASGGTFPGTAGRKTGWFYKVSVAGTVDGVSFSVGDDLFAVVDTASTSTYAANWLKIEGSITLAEIVAALGFTPADQARTISAAGLATGGGDLSANRTITVPIASQAEAEAGSDNTKGMTPLRVAQAIAALATGGSTALPRSYLAGMKTSNNVGTPNTKIDVTVGTCRDDANTVNITFAASKTIDCGTTGANALDTGALANNTWYHVFAISTAGGTAAALASTSLASPTMPATYVNKRRIGSFKTDGSAQIIAYTQIGDQFWWATAVLDINATIGGTSAVLAALSVPTGLNIEAIFNAVFGGVGANNQLIISSPLNADAAVSLTAAPLFNLEQYNMGNAKFGGGFRLMTDTSAQIRYRAITNDGAAVLVTTLGWADRRGRDD